MKKKPIQLSVVGRPNVGKSTLVNGLLKENRVIANDLAGTTRDSVTVSWTYAGRRITLVDTAGIKPGTRVKTEVDAMVGEQVQRAIDYSHVVICLIDSVEAFTSSDMVSTPNINSLILDGHQESGGRRSWNCDSCQQMGLD
jgi:GTPase